MLRDSVPGTLAEIAANLAWARSIDGAEGGLIRPMIAPHAADTHTPETIRAVLAAARQLGHGIHLHLCQGRGETEAVQRAWGQRPVAWLEQLGLFEERVFGAHEGRVQTRRRALAALALVGLEHAAHKRPGEISGGMKQRVGIARALSMEPKVLLMDEPFGALDALTRARLQDELLAIVAQTQSTVVMVTHDVDEAVLLSDRIVMMTNGPSATIGDVLTVDLPRPRDRVALADDPRYQHCRKAVIDFLYTRQSHVEKVD